MSDEMKVLISPEEWAKKSETRTEDAKYILEHGPAALEMLRQQNSSLRRLRANRAKRAEEKVDGYHPINKSPSLGDWVLVRFVPGFIQPYKVVKYLEDKFGNRRFGPHMDRQIDRWWPLPEVRNE